MELQIVLNYNYGMSENLLEQSEDYKRIEQAIEFMERTFRDHPGLDEIAASVFLSKYHFQRMFKRWAGVTPAQFLHYLTIEYAKERLRESCSIFETTLDAGLSSPSRLHDLFGTFEAMTPGEYKKCGIGLDIFYGFHPTLFGDCLLAATARGICALRFISQESKDIVIAQLKQEWPLASFVERPTMTLPILQRVFSAIHADEKRRFHLILKGTNFQIQVWQALLAIPPGAMVSYQDVAEHISGASAARAVANAVASNPIGYIIPCHRVISKEGKIHRYRWGTARKKAILGWEASHSRV
ncbi:MAG: methylated-DNA--[protein]-cysteine S-methyltransferase [Anaerolineaceae bacterium]|nr:methylated-DNA--[protein]-cysteine S-methyltransferase [Anaerolineaceae bacterium]